MAVSKTRNLLIDTARQLFARDGVESTTMNDIAVASNKGRRTLYTYFRDKEEIYLAVIESELKQLVDSLQEVASKKVPADEKLHDYIFTRMDAVKKTVVRNGTLRARFFRDIWKVEQVRRYFDQMEVTTLRKILQEGVDNDIFQVDSVDGIALVLHYSLKGLDVPYIKGTFNELGIDRKELRSRIMDMVFNGIKTK
ncbi:MAG: TetR/AcrR family transcriptional regulator [Bacteroidales bacterium]